MVDETPTTTAGEATVTALAANETMPDQEPRTPDDDAGSGEFTEAVDDLLRQLTGFVRSMKRGIGKLSGLRRDGIEYAAYGLLAHLVVEGPRRTTALAEAVHADPSTVSRQTAALVRHGLLERRPDPEDGRASILAATPDGERVFQENRRDHCLRMAEILADWPVDDVKQLTSLLSRLNLDANAYYQHTDGDPNGAVIELRGRRR
ncbi:MAG TPA: MarR family transcriptional regulator [Pseudonocardiaceae bacterium]|nr:MarR family transcriptional regulator [Pseudonocardiaceae bacterium]